MLISCLIDLTPPFAAAAIASTVCTGKMGMGKASSEEGAAEEVAAELLPLEVVCTVVMLAG